MGRTGAIVVAAGRGERMDRGDHDEKKQFLPLGGLPVYAWSVKAMADSDVIDEIVVVTGHDDVERIKREIEGDFLKQNAGIGKVSAIVPGGPTRQSSVKIGLDSLSRDVKWVVVHDGVRPFVDAQLIASVAEGAKTHGAATSALPVNDTVKVVDQQSMLVVHTPPRKTLWAAQTPQAFSRRLLEKAHAFSKNDLSTDDCSLIEAMGERVAIVPGSSRNIKITTSTDFVVAELFVKKVSETADETNEPLIAPTPEKQPDQPVRFHVATGFGFDVHRLAKGRPLILGGIPVDYRYGLVGHSDADVVAHAVTDALLGAVSLGDIGTHFPDTDASYKDADSMALLAEVVHMATGTGARIVHVDVFISAERPKLNPLIGEMRRNIAETIGVDIRCVNVKAGTGEGAGPVGRGEVIEARAVATVERYY